MASQYDSWSKDALVARILELELGAESAPKSVRTKTKSNRQIAYDNQLKPQSNVPRPKSEKPFVFDAHPTRKVALKFCYSGSEYGGLAFQDVPGPLPTVEQTIFDAMVRARLVDGAKGFDGCGWERCGRTDRGVSAAGQVMSVWLRSAIASSDNSEDKTEPLSDSATPAEEEEDPDYDMDDPFGGLSLSPSTTTNALPESNTHPQELNYVSILNAILPPTIRILAYSPVPPDFSSRFACRRRHYKYFFTSPSPTTTPPHDHLDIPSMQDAAARLVGEHDFRNLCKLDPGKQITNFHRTIDRADISSLGTDDISGQSCSSYVFDLVGSAFLYHQVRHIMAILFLVGAGLELPSIVTSLLNVDGSESPPSANAEETDETEVVPQKPLYEMADALPLMLWDCTYDEGVLHWRVGDEPESSDPSSATISEGGTDLYHQIHSIHTRSTIRTILDAHFLSAAARITSPAPKMLPLIPPGVLPPTGENGESVVINVPLGGGKVKRTGRYVRLLERGRMEDVGVANERWRNGVGRRREEKKRGGSVGEEE